MTPVQYDIMDELYFPVGFDDLCATLSMEEGKLRDEVLEMYRLGWIKVLVPETEEAVEETEQIEKNYKKYCYLASRAGLSAHNSR